MYLKRIYDENVGPIEKLDIELSFTEDGKPKPIIFVGENGTGKSILLSNIVDAFYEISSVAYSDSMVKDDQGNKIYYKGFYPREIKNGEKYLLSYLDFFDNDNKENVTQSVFKLGKLSNTEVESRIKNKLAKKIQIDGTNHYKQHTATLEFSKKMFGKEIICYFPPSRYATPNWQNHGYGSESDKLNLTLSNKESGSIHNNITVTGDLAENLAWLLDVIVDSRTEIIPVIHDILSEFPSNPLIENGFKFKDIMAIADENLRSSLGLEVVSQLCDSFDQNLVLQIARENTEIILSKILGEEVYFDLQPRNYFS